MKLCRHELDEDICVRCLRETRDALAAELASVTGDAYQNRVRQQAARIRSLEAALTEASRMMAAVKRTWGPESHDDGADGELWAWLNDFITRYPQSETACDGESNSTKEKSI